MYKRKKDKKFLMGVSASQASKQSKRNKKRTEQITSESINDAVQKFLSDGNSIQIIEPTIDYFGDEPVDNWKYNDTRQGTKN